MIRWTSLGIILRVSIVTWRAGVFGRAMVVRIVSLGRPGLRRILSTIVALPIGIVLRRTGVRGRSSIVISTRGVVLVDELGDPLPKRPVHVHPLQHVDERHQRLREIV
ncbi:MAG: hypothetical protein ABEI31_05075, partial [Halodesulfurarchaeum sp.]